MCSLSASMHQFQIGIPSSMIKSGSDYFVSHNQNQQEQTRVTKTEVPFLPEDVIYKILLSLPAKDLRGAMSTVCRSWYKLIRDPVFTKAYSSCSTTSPFCLLIYNSFFRILSLKNDQITWKFSNTINQEYLTHGDGFILARTYRGYSSSILYLVNPVTQQIFSLPRLLVCGAFTEKMTCTVSCSPLTNKYKVVIWHSTALYILTVGDDKEWRKIDFGRQTSFGLHPITAHRGLLYCSKRETDFNLIALDVEKEVFHDVILPKEVSTYMPEMCSGTSLVMNIGTTRDCMEFWELVNYRNGGQWKKFGIVDFKSKNEEIAKIVGRHNRPSSFGHDIKPVVVLSRDVIIFKFDRRFLAYNFKTENLSQCFDYIRLPLKFELMMDNSLDVL